MRSGRGLIACLVLLLVSGCQTRRSGAPWRGRPSLPELLGPAPTSEFLAVETPRRFLFPADHGPHRDQRTEWWYLVGHLQAEDGGWFGYQATFFRFGLTTLAVERSSAWSATELFMAHLGVTDIDGGTHRSFERLSRGAVGLAGATASPFAIWVDDWRLDGMASPDSFPWRLQARQGGLGLDLRLEVGKPPVLHGEAGLSAKGPEPGQASYYYSLPRLPTTGSLVLDGRARRVSGESWLDREWSSSLLGRRQVGWDWFALQFDDQSELMLFQLRRRDGSSDWTSGTLISPDGSAVGIRPGALSVQPTARWQSPSTGVSYPSGWRVEVPSAGIDLEVRPLVADQELDQSFRYWEGAVVVHGSLAGRSVSGRGYVELVGY